MSTPRIFKLANEFLEIEVLDLGATLISFKHKRDGINVVVRYQDLNQYKTSNAAYLGSSIGPCAGRLANSMLDDMPLVSNEDNNSHLHGGVHGIHSAVFECEIKDHALVFRATVDHSQDGYPGIVDYVITYELSNESLILTHNATPHNKQYLNTTNHSYFNLLGSDSVLDHALQISASKISLVNEFGWNEGKTLDVENTLFDFQTAKPIRDCVRKDHDQFQFTRSLDHFYHGNHLSLSTDTKILDIDTDRYGFQIYTANYFDEGFVREDGTLAKSFSAVAVEPQSFNNEPNLGAYTMYDKDHPYQAKTTYNLYFKD